MVRQTYTEQFCRIGIEEVKDPEKADLIVVNGEGSLHHGRRRDLLEWPSKYPSVFINAVYDSNPPDDRMNEFLFVAVRESRSAELLRSQGVPCSVIPDIVITHNALVGKERHSRPAGVAITDNVVNAASGFSAMRPPWEYLEWLSQSRRAVCGRFHAALCCACLEIPFSTWDSNTHKIQGLMEDMGVPQHHYSLQDEAVENLPQIFEESIREYIWNGHGEVDRMFERILKIGEAQ
jgi:hypothetical protein